MTIKLQVEKRSETGKKLKSLRADGKIPGVVYGAKQESTALTLDRREFDKAFEVAGESSVLVLTGLDEDKEVLIHDVTFNQVKGGIQHVDFYAVEKGKKVTVHVPIEFTGEAPAIKLGGSLTQALRELEVTAEPSKLPHEITVDVSVLVTFEDQIRVKDLDIPAGVTVENDPEETVAVVSEAKEEEEVVAEVDMSAIEVEQKGKKEEGEEEKS